MRRHHAGSGRRAVIPTDWAATHRPVAEGTMLGRISLREPGTHQVWSDADEQNIAVPLDPYATAVPARVQALAGQARVFQFADDTEVIADYLVTVPVSHVVAGGHLVDVTGCDDPDLAGRTLRVEKAVRGTELFERDLFCTLDD